MINSGKLAGKTLFISGASRGIGKAIALKAAKDGANIAIAAKTAEAHPKLPGTIYTAAKEIEEAGGKCLPCVVDIQREDQVEEAVSSTVKAFGGIDILVNNASAINLTGTLQTSMKKYDLMNNVNARGTYLCSQKCLPHLLKSENPHILNISPPLNMSSKWFGGHVAYTMAKYGMSMCVLGMAEEFRDQNVAVNALWPKTAIYTAAMAMLGGGDVIAKQCRNVDIMSDAAYAILIKDSKSFTGNFAIDEAILKQEGITDFEQYACVPGSKLLPDFFLDDTDLDALSEQLVKEGGKPAFTRDAPPSGSGDVDKTFSQIRGLLNDEMCKAVGGIFQFDLSGDEAGCWYLDLKNAPGCVSREPPASEVECTMKMESSDFVKMFAGVLKPTAAFMDGKLKIRGNVALAMKMEKLMGKMTPKL